MALLGNVIDDTTKEVINWSAFSMPTAPVYSHNVLQNSLADVEMFALRAVTHNSNLARSCPACGTGDAAATKYVVVSRNQIKTNSYAAWR
jgi:hypothetical protein